MTTKDEILELAQQFKEQAKKILSKDKYLAPVVFLITPDKSVIPCVIQHETDEEKRLVYRKIVEVGRSNNAIGAISIHEAWMGTNINQRPSEDPTRREAVIVSALGRELSVAWLIPFHREDEEIVFEAEIPPQENMEVVNNLLRDMFKYDA